MHNFPGCLVVEVELCSTDLVAWGQVRPRLWPLVCCMTGCSNMQLAGDWARPQDLTAPSRTLLQATALLSADSWQFK